MVEHIPTKSAVIGNQKTFVFELKAAVEVMESVPIVETDGAIEIPLEHQRPIGGVILPEQPELIYTLIMTEPTATTGYASIDR